MFVGNQVQQRKGVLDVHAPIAKGIIQDWENIEKIWHYVFYEELKVVPEDHPCLLTEGRLIFYINMKLKSAVESS